MPDVTLSFPFRCVSRADRSFHRSTALLLRRYAGGVAVFSHTALRPLVFVVVERHNATHGGGATCVAMLCVRDPPLCLVFISLSSRLCISSPSGLAATLPEDLYCLIKKAVSVRKHLERNRKDKDSKFRLILIESRIHRLARYYKRMKAVAPTFKYESATASTLVA